MTETAWWLILGVAVLLAIAGALRFDVLGLFLRDRLEHPDATPGKLENEVPPQGPAPAARHPAHDAHHRKPQHHRSGGRHS